jgi:uncharacterized Fe-S cluster protein YjdI/CDGSH-type Zn-finger protein
MAPDVQREYRAGQIVVYWEPTLCIHTTECLRGLPQVFNVRRRPWVAVTAATADEIAAVVSRCPTSALRFARLDGGLQEQPDEPARIVAQPDGPLYLRGDIDLVDQDGNRRRVTRAALCRCGQSKNKPFCDNSHLESGFRTT